MHARLRKLLNDLAETFWLLPGALVFFGVGLGWALVEVERAGTMPDWLLKLVYGGGESGARAVLGAIASSTIGVAGTIFSITIAALTLASTQMGPRLLRNFTRDLGNQVTLGTLLGTFAYSLVVLRTVRGDDGFIPHLALSVGVGLALACIGVVVLFVHHMATRINVDVVINLVHDDLAQALEGLPKRDSGSEPEGPSWNSAEFDDWRPVTTERYGYLAQLDEGGLKRWATEAGGSVEMLVRPGHYVFAGAAVARVRPPLAEAEKAVRNALVLGGQPGVSGDFEFAVRQLVEVAARALSPGINDPITANQVLDRLGSALCVLAGRELPRAEIREGERVLLIRATITYAELVGAMFDLIRQNAQSQPIVLTHLVEVLGKVVECERDADRVSVLIRQAALALDDGRRSDANRADLAALERGYARVRDTTRRGGPDALETSAVLDGPKV